MGNLQLADAVLANVKSHEYCMSLLMKEVNHVNNLIEMIRVSTVFTLAFSH
jgi:hypothetical protein